MNVRVKMIEFKLSQKYISLLSPKRHKEILKNVIKSFLSKKCEKRKLLSFSRKTYISHYLKRKEPQTGTFPR